MVIRQHRSLFSRLNDNLSSSLNINLYRTSIVVQSPTAIVTVSEILSSLYCYWMVKAIVDTHYFPLPSRYSHPNILSNEIDDESVSSCLNRQQPQNNIKEYRWRQLLKTVKNSNFSDESKWVQIITNNAAEFLKSKWKTKCLILARISNNLTESHQIFQMWILLLISRIQKNLKEADCLKISSSKNLKM